MKRWVWVLLIVCLTLLAGAVAFFVVCSAAMRGPWH